MTHASLFSGIGGFDLAAEWMGWENIFHCEWNPFGQKVLAHHFPNSKSYNDITKTDFSVHKGTVDILTGGFPCQPYSLAGKRLGKKDERHLFPEMLRAVEEIQPTWVVGENVLGIVNWGGGVVFNEVQTDLENKGYEVQAYILPACAKNAPHLRNRTWFIAYSELNSHRYTEPRRSGQKEREIWGENKGDVLDTLYNDGASSNANDKSRIKRTNNSGWENNEQKSYDRNNIWNNIRSISKSKDVTNSDSIRLEHSKKARNIQESTGTTQGKRSKSAKSIKTNGFNGDATDSNSSRFQTNNTMRKSKREEFFNRVISKDISTNSTSNGGGQDNRFRESRFINKESKINNWQYFPTQSPICGGDDGLPKELDNITFSKWRNESIKAYGNAIVPQVAFEIFKAINLYNKNLKK